MNYERQKRLVERLLEKTRTGELNWQESALADAFQVSFSKYSVSIRHIAVGDSAYYQITITDWLGNVTEFFDNEDLNMEQVLPSKNWDPIMREIFEMARRKVVGADEALDSILSEIN